MINNPSRIVRVKDKQFYGQTPAPYKFLRVGRVDRVDNEKNNIAVTWLDYMGGHNLIPISCAFASPRAFLGGMPQIGSVVICGFSKQTQTSGQPQIISYLSDGYRNALWYLLDRGNYENTKKDMFDSAVDNNTVDAFIKEKINHIAIRRKRRKLYPGEIQGESDSGSELYLDNDLHLTNSGLEEIQLRSSDHHIISNSVNHTVITGAAKIKNGIITRNLNVNGIAVDNPSEAAFKQYIILPNGKKLFVVTADYKDLDTTDTETLNQSGGGAFNEIRTEIHETCSGETKVTEETTGSEIDYTLPFITHVLGTNVGNDHTNRLTYGKILRPRIFQTPEDTKAIVGDDIVTNDISRLKSLATAFELKFDNSGTISKERTDRKFYNNTKISIDKQGHAFIHLAASTNDHSLGAGRSLEFNADGSLKIVIGANTAKLESILMHTKGGNRFAFGTSTAKRSLDLTLESALYMKIQSGDNAGTALTYDISGNVSEKIKGNKTLTIDGNYTVIVSGIIDERIKAIKMETYVKDKFTNYGGDFVSNVLGKNETNIAMSRLVSISGDIINSNTVVDKLNIVSGTSFENITLGNKKINLTKGNLEETLLFGDKKLNITIGNYSKTLNKGNDEEVLTLGDKITTITTGNYKINITKGDITVKTTLGSVTISGSSDIKISGLNITLDAVTTHKVIAGVLSVIESKLIKLGGNDAIQPGVLGFQLLSWLSSHTHIHPMGPTGPAIIPPTTSLLSSTVFLK